jgi:hypothetical protein
LKEETALVFTGAIFEDILITRRIQKVRRNFGPKSKRESCSEIALNGQPSEAAAQNQARDLESSLWIRASPRWYHAMLA